jgi:hypothetical protein
MINIVKKIILFITLLIYTPFIAIPAYAQSINPCNNINGFKALCNLGGSGNDVAHLIAVVVQLLLIAAVVISLIFLIIGGIRWVTSGGDKAKLESARGHVVAAIVGLVIALAAFLIIQLVLTIFGIKGGLGGIKLPTFGP